MGYPGGPQDGPYPQELPQLHPHDGRPEPQAQGFQVGHGGIRHHHRHGTFRHQHHPGHSTAGIRAERGEDPFRHGGEGREAKEHGGREPYAGLQPALRFRTVRGIADGCSGGAGGGQEDLLRVPRKQIAGTVGRRPQQGRSPHPPRDQMGQG